LILLKKNFIKNYIDLFIRELYKSTAKKDDNSFN
jgi:hypothetical protein